MCCKDTNNWQKNAIFAGNLKNMKHLAYYITIFLSLLALPSQAQSYYVQCEDTCSHIHGIDLSHYQGNVFWETIGDNTHMAYVYLKATEGGDRIDATFERNPTEAVA